MVVFTDKIYYSDNIKEKRRGKLQRKLEMGKSPRDVYCIASPTNPQTLFDIIPAKELVKRYYEGAEVKVAGIAKGKDEAEELVRQLVETMYAATSGFDAKSFFF